MIIFCTKMKSIVKAIKFSHYKVFSLCFSFACMALCMSGSHFGSENTFYEHFMCICYILIVLLSYEAIFE